MKRELKDSSCAQLCVAVHVGFSALRFSVIAFSKTKLAR